MRKAKALIYKTRNVGYSWIVAKRQSSGSRKVAICEFPSAVAMQSSRPLRSL